MRHEAIILAGGEGTRIKAIEPNLPKSLIEVNGKPFLYYLISQLQNQGWKHIVLALGNKSSQIVDYTKKFFSDSGIQFSIEEKPLGTGGAIKKALSLCKNENILVLNGDTFLEIDLPNFLKFHENNHADISIAVKKIENGSRFGEVVFSSDKRINNFIEKKESIEPKWINAGAYIISKKLFNQYEFTANTFSFEKDVLEKYISKLRLMAFPVEGYFIDIGIPEDLTKARNEFKERNY